ncbi:MAG TPA: hypothetical protein VFP84_22740 [Kofleriaceae bacterium]|nr:hypothetical protein [Kofleriaceae bacterium]
MASDDEHVRSERLADRPASGPCDDASRAHDEPDELPETIRSRLERLVPELVKKTFAAGLGAVFQTEEGIRKIASERLPEVAGYIASSADGAKDKVIDAIGRETRDFLASLNVGEEIAKILTTLSFEIKTEIRFIPNSERFTGAEPEVKASVRLKRADEKDKDGKDGRDSKDVKDGRDGRDGKDGRDARDGRDGKEKAKDEPRDEPRSRLRFWQRGDSDGGDDGPNK